MLLSFDGQRIVELLKNQEHFASYYTNNKGEKKMLFDIVKKYQDNIDVYGIGCTIDVHNALLSQESVYVTEYLVDKRFIEEELSKKCDLELVESDLYDNQFKIHMNYFKNIAKYEEVKATRDFLMNAAEYFNQNNDINKACYEITKLYRYYIFRKRSKISNKSSSQSRISKKTNKKKIMKGGTNVTLDELANILDPNKYIKREMESKYSLLSSIHDILVNSNIIPKNNSFEELYNDINYKLCDDHDITHKQLTKLCKSLIIDHKVTKDEVNIDSISPESNTDKIQNILNGLNIIILEKDCDNDPIISTFSKQSTFDTTCPTVLIFKSNEQYSPIYKKRNDGVYDGLFDTKIKLIKRLLNIKKKENSY
jgi:hypothetical protein